jgi:tRNA (guanine10-N2)-dimethyltransferase
MIYELSKENLDLAKEEVIRLGNITEYMQVKNFLICEGDIDYNRLAYTKQVFKFIFLGDDIPDVDWEKYYHKNFRVRSNITLKEPELAKIIWKRLKNPIAKMVGSETEFHINFLDDKILCGKLIWKQTEKFHLRRPDLRPGFFPVSMKPKLARALINLSGVQHGKIFDPFCGTGGILLEGAMIGLEVEGSDLDKNMVLAAKKNFLEYQVYGEFSVADARKKIVKAKAIVTDPPYGRRASLKKSEIESLYKDFLNHVYSFTDTVVLMYPKGMNLVTSFKISFQCEEYIHNSLTRIIVILKKI